ncbi:MAG: hypothetical protein JSS55_10910 [Proteobacteria bacterium]|nr:hypothetical protein [Pseudomonadota bacterium]
MTHPFIRAAAFAVLAMILLAVLSVVVFLFLIGMPKDANALAAFQAEAAARAPMVDLILGGLIMLGCGWLAARPSGSDALQVAALMALFYIVIDVAIILMFGDVTAMAVGTTGLSYAVKTVAALIGGFLASRTPATPDPIAPE